MKIFYKNQSEIRFTINHLQHQLKIQLRIHDYQQAYSQVFREDSSDFNTSLKKYFPSISSFYHFIDGLNDKFIACSKQGTIKLTLFDEQLQQRTIQIKLHKYNTINLVKKTDSLQQSFTSLAKFTYKMKQEYQDQLSYLRRQFQAMRLRYESSIQDLQTQLQNESNKSLQNLIYVHKMHNKLKIKSNKVINSAMNYEIRWAIIGPQVSQQNTTYIKFKINKMNWIAFGLCFEGILKSRKYSRLNGCGPNGVYAMDNTGWIYAHNDQRNYKHLGFSYEEGHTITLIYCPEQNCITFINHQTWQRYDLHLPKSIVGLSPCIACSKQTQIQIIDYEK